MTTVDSWVDSWLCSKPFKGTIETTKYPNGTRKWWRNGKLHREDGPAIEWANGGKEWWRNGTRHRTDGPAIEYDNGDISWFLEGKLFKCVHKFCKAAKLTDEEKTFFLLKWSK